MIARTVVRGLRRVFELPGPVVRRLWGPPPRNDRGVALDRQLQILIGLQGLLPAHPLSSATAAQLRRETRRNAVLVSLAPRGDLEVTSATVAGRAARVYRPGGGSSAPAPALVYYHGGGFVIGDLDTHDSPCRLLALGSRCVVISVDYRLAPEQRYPVATRDALAAFRWVVEHAPELGVDPTRVAVGGDSAGGNLAAVTCALAREDGGAMPCLQVLIYPGTDLTRSHRSHRTYAEGFYLTTELISWFLDRYLADPSQARQWQASPLFLDSFGGLPPAHVITAGFDPLRDEGEAYAEKLRAAGVPVEARCEEPLIHGFANMAGASREARRAVARIASSLGRALTPGPSS